MVSVSKTSAAALAALAAAIRTLSATLLTALFIVVPRLGVAGRGAARCIETGTETGTLDVAGGGGTEGLRPGSRDGSGAMGTT